MQQFEQIWKEASNAANKAYKETIPTLVVFGQAESLFSNNIVKGTEEYCSEGLCGFAWIKVSGRGKFATWLKKNNLARKDSYYGGLSISVYSLVDNSNQSFERKENAMQAASEVFNSYGIKAIMYSRLD